jgi:hypothetical protein
LILEAFGEGLEVIGEGEDVVDPFGCVLGAKSFEAPGVEAGGDEAGDAVGIQEELFGLGAEDKIPGQAFFAVIEAAVIGFAGGENELGVGIGPEVLMGV